MSSISRAFEILERFRQLQRPLSLKELVTHFGYPSSSVADILKTLSQGGYISFDPITRAYFPTTRLGELGGWIMTDVLQQAYPVEVLNHLRMATADTILLGTPNDLEVIYIAVLESQETDRPLTTGRRTHRPLIKSGVGRALLSLDEDPFIERIYRRSVARGLCDGRELSLDDLMREIETCRRDGYVFLKDSFNPNAAIVAAPMPIAYHAQRLAIGIGGPTERIESRVDILAGILLDQMKTLTQPAKSILTHR